LNLPFIYLMIIEIKPEAMKNLLKQQILHPSEIIRKLQRTI